MDLLLIRFVDLILFLCLVSKWGFFFFLNNTFFFFKNDFVRFRQNLDTMH